MTSEEDPADIPNITITIAAHTRHYGDGTTVEVDGGTLTGASASKQYFIYYDDEFRAGGAVTYQKTFVAADAVQDGNRHTVGTIGTSSDGTATGGGGTTGSGIPSSGGRGWDDAGEIP